MQLPSLDIKDILEAGDLELYFNQDSSFDNLFIGREPELPKNSVTIFDTAGRAPQLTVDAVTGYEFPSVQIRVRNTDYETGWTLINNIKDLLHGKHNETWNGALYTVIYCASGPALLDWENNCCRFIINFNMERR
jgi:hypothetical protein